jgi:hypothetical protein
MANENSYIRQLTIQDLDECLAVETAAFPPAEAATREKVSPYVHISRFILNTSVD